MRIDRLLVLFFVLVLTSVPASAEIYRWVDDKGVAHFSDTPPPDSSEATEEEEASVSDLNAQDSSAPAVQSQNFAIKPDFSDIPNESPEASEAVKQPSVELYVTSWCAYCAKAKQFFRSKGIEFAVFDVEKDKNAARRMSALTSNRAVPFAVINGQKIQGYSEEAYQAALNN
jgi:glutaredoxin